MPLINHWLLSDNRARIGLAVALPCILFALAPILNQAWKRITTKDEVHAPAPAPVPNNEPVLAPPPPPFDRIPASSSAAVAGEKSKRADGIPIAMDQTVESSDRPLPDPPSSDNNSGHKEPDSFSIGSSGSSEHKPRKLRVGKNLKRAWSNRPFAHAHEQEPAVSPLSPEGR